MTFYFERALTDSELSKLEDYAHALLAVDEGYEAAKVYNVYVGTRAKWAILQEVIETDEKEPVTLFPELASKWKAYVRSLLGTKSWNLGCGFVGSSEPILDNVC